MEPEIEVQIRDAIRRDNPQALVCIYDHMGGSLHAFFLASFRCRETAEDMLQELFVKIARKRKQLLKSGNLEQYIFAMARNLVHSHWRTRKRRHVHIDDWDTILESGEAGDVVAEHQDDARMLAGLLWDLPARQREIIVLKLFHNMTFDGIARNLGISIHTASSRYRYGIQK